MRVRVSSGIVAALFPILLSSTSLAAWQEDGLPVCTATGSQQSPAAVLDGAGGVFLAWSDPRNGVSDVYAQRIDAGGNALWTADGIPVCTATGDQSAPVLMVDGQGGVIIMWHDWRNQVTSNQDLYAQRFNGAGAALWTANGVAVTNAAAGQHYPKLVSDGAGGVLAVWMDLRNGSLNSDIYGARITSVGTVLDTPTGIVVSTAVQSQTPGAMVPYGGGGGIVAWTDARTGSPNIYAARISAAGTVLDATGIPLCVAGGDQTAPNAIPDGAGGAIVAWSDVARNGEIFAQRIDTAGAIQWTPDGVDVGANVLSSIGQQPAMAPDGAGGAIIAFERFDTGNLNVYAQRINSSGVKQWAPTSLPVCTASGTQSGVVSASDFAGGAVVGWTDTRNLTMGTDIFAQRVLPNGTVAWLANGVTVCDDPLDQSAMVMVPDETGGAIFAWADKRLNVVQSDIYAHRLAGEGQTPTPVHGLRSVTLLGDAYPNPFNPSTSIPFSLVRAGHVTLSIYDVSGAHVATLVDEHRDAGEHIARWNGRTNAGAAATTGVYFVRLHAGGAVETRKIALLK